jgi:hypothetical protein
MVKRFDVDVMFRCKVRHEKGEDAKLGMRLA